MARRDKPAGFIETKLNAPAVGDRFISRRPLFKDFIASPDRNVLSVVAAAGSGKSTLLSELYQALVAEQVPSCWLSLDAEDDSPASFATYLIAALGTLNQGRHPDTLNLPRANPARDFEPLFNDIVAMISALQAPVAIFLDDLQNLRDEQLLRFLNKLLHRLPPCVKVAFASREVPLIDLARLRVAGRLLEVQQGDLSFSTSDARTFLARVHDLELDEQDLSALISTTEGWPTGLQLAALALRRHRGLSKAAAREKAIALLERVRVGSAGSADVPRREGGAGQGDGDADEGEDEFRHGGAGSGWRVRWRRGRAGGWRNGARSRGRRRRCPRPAGGRR